MISDDRRIFASHHCVCSFICQRRGKYKNLTLLLHILSLPAARTSSHLFSHNITDKWLNAVRCNNISTIIYSKKDNLINLIKYVNRKKQIYNQHTNKYSKDLQMRIKLILPGRSSVGLLGSPSCLTEFKMGWFPLAF